MQSMKEDASNWLKKTMLQLWMKNINSAKEVAAILDSKSETVNSLFEED